MEKRSQYRLHNKDICDDIKKNTMRTKHPFMSTPPTDFIESSSLWLHDIKRINTHEAKKIHTRQQHCLDSYTLFIPHYASTLSEEGIRTLLHESANTLPIRKPSRLPDFPAQSQACDPVKEHHAYHNPKLNSKTTTIESYKQHLLYHLRTPLNHLQNQLHTLKQINNSKQTDIQPIESSLSDYLQLLEDSLDPAATKSSAATIRKVCLYDALNVWLSVYKKSFARKRIVFVLNYKIHKKAIFYLAEEAMYNTLKQLLQNALTFTEKGSVQLRIDPDGHHTLQFSITDSGIGIEPKHMSSIFEKFSRGGCIPGQYPGIGLGLYHAQQTMLQIGGMISATSQLGVGSTFTMHIPCRKSRKRDSNAIAPAKQNNGANHLHILIIDDCEIAQLAVRTQVEKRFTNTRITLTNNLNDATKTIKNSRFHVYVVDLNLHGQNAMQLVPYIKKAHADAIIIVASGHITQRVRQEALTLGASLAISKPIHAQDLIAIEKHINNRFKNIS